jgi:hypothetical protein
MVPLPANAIRGMYSHMFKWLNFKGYLQEKRCNDPKPLCKDHHGFGVFLKLLLSEVFRQTVC